MIILHVYIEAVRLTIFNRTVGEVTFSSVSLVFVGLIKQLSTVISVSFSCWSFKVEARQRRELELFKITSSLQVKKPPQRICHILTKLIQDLKNN